MEAYRRLEVKNIGISRRRTQTFSSADLAEEDMLALRAGEMIRITADGPDEAAAFAQRIRPRLGDVERVGCRLLDDAQRDRGIAHEARDHPLVAKANLAARLNNPRYSDADMVKRCQDLWATIRVTPRQPPALIHSMDIAVEGGDGTMYVGAENDRRGRKRMRTAFVELRE
mgnify:CR=1 FL=1